MIIVRVFGSEVSYLWVCVCANSFIFGKLYQLDKYHKIVSTKHTCVHTCPCFFVSFILFGRRRRPLSPPLLLPTRSFANIAFIVICLVHKSSHRSHSYSIASFFWRIPTINGFFYPRTSTSKFTHNQPCARPPANKMITWNHEMNVCILFIITKMNRNVRVFSGVLFIEMILPYNGKNLEKSFSILLYAIDNNFGCKQIKSVN